tara:strand:+ start:408 stop:1049 length:642 start_codon:yes stop_codon:yes gene_type:complete
MGFKMKGMTFGAGTGSEKPKTISDIDRDASSEVAMDSAMGKKMQAPLKNVNMTKEEMEKFTADLKADAAQKETDKGSFGDAFNAARSAGKKEFTYKGKKYHTRTKEEEDARKKDNTKSSGDDSTKSSSNDNKSMKKETKSVEVDRPDYQKRRQQARLDRRRARGAGTSDIFDIRTDKKEARMKYGRGSEEFKKYKQELKDAKKSARQERRDNR